VPISVRMYAPRRRKSSRAGLTKRCGPALREIGIEGELLSLSVPGSNR